MDYPKVIIVDVDGVLTDGTIYYTQAGERFKGFHTRDIRAFRELIAHGYEVTIMTASSWPGLTDFAERCGVDIIVAREKEKFKPAVPYICVCDDIADLALISGATGCFAPHDCDPAIRSSFVRILNTCGGRGVMAEMVTILKQLHKWMS